MQTAAEGPHRFAARFSCRLTFVFAVSILLLVASLLAALWMAERQDRMLRDTLRSSVSTSLANFAGSAQISATDYAVWDDAFLHVPGGDIDWIRRNVGTSVELGTFQMALVIPPDAPSLGFRASDIPQPADAIVGQSLLHALRSVPLGADLHEHGVATGFVRLADDVWMLAITRTMPQTEPLPAGTTDASLTRMVFGYRLDDRLLSKLAGFEILRDVALSPVPSVRGRDGIPLEGFDHAPTAWLTWTAPRPAHAVLHAFFLPIVILAVVLSIGAALVMRELMRAASSLEAALVEARAADVAKTEFLSNVNHELRTPLGGIIGLAQLLQTHALDREAREMVDLLLASAHAQLHLVNGLLEIARIESGTLQLATAPFDPAAVLEQTIKLAAPDIAAKGLVVATLIAPDLPRFVLGDAQAFRQIATNLVGNAVKFTERGRIAARLSQEADGRLTLAVADTGIGIDPADHERIFARFSQVDGSLSRRAGGAGLGLAITAALVELMGGTLRVESVLGRGSTFFVTLPLPPAPDAPQPA